MPRFVTTIEFTQQGAQAIRDSCDRAEAFRTKAKSMGVDVGDIYWTLGQHDGLIVLDAPDEETATAAMLELASAGNVRTSTSRAFTPDEFEQVLGKL